MLAAIVINIDPILVQLGPLAIRWYGLMYVVGIVLGVRAALPFVVAHGITEDQVWNILGPCIVAGLVGGRLYFVVQQPLEPYLAQPWRILATWEGGMAFFGAIFGVVLTLAIMAWREKFAFWWLFDGAVILAAVGQFFGRIGNVVNGDILGPPTSAAWGFIYANPNSFAQFHNVPYQPAAVFEMVGNVIIIAFLFFMRSRVRSSGLIASVYLLCYSVSQFILFFVRNTEPTVGLNLKQAQLTSIVVFVVACGLLAYRLRAAREDGAPSAQPAIPVADAQ